MYNRGARELQEAFGTTRLADRLSEKEARRCLTDEDREFVGGACMFFLSTTDESGQPLCSYKGGLPGFVRVEDDRTLLFPSYDGNGTFRSLGNISLMGKVALLFIDLTTQRRTLVEGEAALLRDRETLRLWEGAQLAVRVQVRRVFSSCSRYIHPHKLVAHSAYVPRRGHRPPVPEWKDKAAYKDVLPEPDAGREESRNEHA